MHQATSVHRKSLRYSTRESQQNIKQKLKSWEEISSENLTTKQNTIGNAQTHPPHIYFHVIIETRAFDCLLHYIYRLLLFRFVVRFIPIEILKKALKYLLLVAFDRSYSYSNGEWWSDIYKTKTRHHTTIRK